MTTPAPALAPAAAPDARAWGIYEWLMLVGALIYLSLPLFILQPSLFALAGQVPAYEGDRLLHLRSLLVAVTPMGLVHLFALWSRQKSLMDLSLVWRLVWVGPWLVANWAFGHLENGAFLFIASVDVGLPLAMLALSADARALWPRLRNHFDTWSQSLARRLMMLEGKLAILLVLVASVPLLLDAASGYVTSFATSIAGCYAVALLWAARSDAPVAAPLALAVRATAIAVFALLAHQGFHPMLMAGYAAFAGLGLYLHAYNLLWERQVQRLAWSLTRWVVTGAVGVMALSAAWYSVSPSFAPHARELAVNIHRQDLIIGGFAVLVALLLRDVWPKARLHATIVAWLLPFSAVWFTLETKLLANLGVGSPLHPSWPARGLGPLWGGSPVVDLTFWLATLFMTAISTTYAAVVLLKYLPRTGWKRLAWHGTGVILVSALWMIASSSGLPAPLEALAAQGSIPPFLPGHDPVTAVNIHVRDLIIGMGLIAAGLFMATEEETQPQLASLAVGLGWWLTLLPKAWFHLAPFVGGSH
ncbi:MAG: hypothetical protein VKP62_14420 [Candidatus Sericytochromatia bacterium]|nr:hypothetical protein [Candidatus Sericytochromatia bacterium]